MALKILLVVDVPAPGTPNVEDDWIKTRLASQGHVVTLANDDAAPAVSVLDTYNLIIIGNSCNANKIGANYDLTTTGVFSVSIVIPPHSLFYTGAIGTGGTTTRYSKIVPDGDPIIPNATNPVTFRTISNSPPYIDTTASTLGSGMTLMLYGVNAGGAALPARLTGARYSQGATLVGGTAAPSRRVGISLLSLGGLDAVGQSWFDNSVTWAKVDRPPTANAGPDQTVNPAVTVTLNGTASYDDGSVSAYTWRQITGPTVTLSSTTVAQPTFTSPSVVTTGTELSFGLIVTDNTANQSPEDTVTITVRASASVKVRVAGAWVVKPAKTRVSGAWKG